MSHLFGGTDAAKSRALRGMNDRVTTQKLGIGGWRAKSRSDAKYVPLAEPEIAELRTAKAHRVLKHDPKDRLKPAAGRTDDLQHLRGRDLLLLQFAHLARARIELVRDGRFIWLASSFWLQTTSCSHRLIQPGSSTFPLHITTSFHCRPRQKPTKFQAYCTMVCIHWEQGQCWLDCRGRTGHLQYTGLAIHMA